MKTRGQAETEKEWLRRQEEKLAWSISPNQRRRVFQHKEDAKKASNN